MTNNLVFKVQFQDNKKGTVFTLETAADSVEDAAAQGRAWAEMGNREFPQFSVTFLRVVEQIAT